MIFRSTFANVKTNHFPMHFYSFIEIAWSTFLCPLVLKRLQFFKCSILNLLNSKFWIGNAVFQLNVKQVLSSHWILKKEWKWIMNTTRCTTLLPPFFSEIRGFIVKNWLYIYDSKYCPLLATTFSHLLGSVRIPRRKNWSSFEAIHESIQFFTSS